MSRYLMIPRRIEKLLEEWTWHSCFKRETTSRSQGPPCHWVICDQFSASYYSEYGSLKTRKSCAKSHIRLFCLSSFYKTFLFFRKLREGQSGQTGLSSHIAVIAYWGPKVSISYSNMKSWYLLMYIVCQNNSLINE